MRRVLAVIGALGMVAAAVLIRQGLDDDGRPRQHTDTDLVIVCAKDLSDACKALGDGVDVRPEIAADTAAALEAGLLADDVDAWITTTAWVEVVDSRSRGALGTPEALATTPTVVATAPMRFEAITDLCGRDDVWACLGGAAGTDWAELGDGAHPEWRELKVGLTDPDSALGLSVLASASAGFFGTTDFAVNDFAEFEGWLTALAEPSATGDADPARTLATRPGTYSAAGSVAAVVEARDVQARGVRAIAPRTDVAATVVAVGFDGLGDGDLPDLGAVGDALVADGWTRASDDYLAPTLKPGVMAALHTLWRKVTA